MKPRILAALALATAASVSHPARAADEVPASVPITESGAERLELNKGDHIAIVGNALAERMQHYGWLETLVHARFPQHELVFRNLGFPGDEIDGFRNPNARLRSMDFGSHDQWLSGSAPVPQPGKLSPRDQGKVRENRFELINTRADVIFAFYGYNESFAGEAGLAKFRENVEAFIKHTLAQKYNGTSAPKLVLFSPIAMEYLNDPNLPGKAEVDATNARLNMYSEAMGEVVTANGVVFVDLFTPTIRLTATQRGARETTQPRARGGRPADALAAGERLNDTLAAGSRLNKSLTMNGIHLNERGDRVVAGIIDGAVFGDAPERASTQLEKLRAAVLDKNFYWYHRYRTTDGYSTYGDRAFLKFAEGPGGYGEGLSNYSVLQRELEMLDVMTANRDKVVWQVARSLRERADGSRSEPATFKPDDSNVPAPIAVISNKPGPLEGGKHQFFSGEEAMSKMTVAPGMKLNLFASEEQFPELVNPVQMSFDTRGRLWVAAWPTYPHWRPYEEMNDKLLILEDTDGDGRADQCKTFAGNLHNPTGFEFWNGGVLVAQAPYLVFLQDTDGDDKADVYERVLGGLDTADTHHTSNSFVLDPGGALYFQEGTFHHTQVETPWGPPERCANAGVFRYEPRTGRFDVHVSYGFANPHGHVFDRWGQEFVTDGTGNVNYFTTAFSGHVDFPRKHPQLEPFFHQRVRPCPATEILSSRHFPPELWNTYLDVNVIGFQGILIYRMTEHESGFVGAEIEPLVQSSDANFRPSDVEVAPDGSLYFIDWHNPIIGHMQHNLRDPSRDRQHGRVYRVTYPGRPLLKPAKIAGEPIQKLLDLLKEPEDRVRYRAKIELSARNTREVIGAVKQWIAGLDKKDAEYEHHLLEALWVHQHHNVVDAELLDRMLESPEPRARAAATRVLCYWRDRVPDALELLKSLAADPHPRVRLEAVRAASFFKLPEAMEVPIIAAEYPTDYYINYCRNETVQTLDPYFKSAVAAGRDVAFTTEAGARYLLRNKSTEQLLAGERTRFVNLELLFRPSVRDEDRRAALAGIAKSDKRAELRVLLDAIHAIDEKKENRDETVLFDLVRLLTGRRGEELGAARGELEKLATSAKQPIVRQVSFAALIAVDGSPDRSWQLGTRSVAALRDLVNAVPLVSDPGLRASLYPKVEPLLRELPPPLVGQASQPAKSGTTGRYVRIELPGPKRTLTLAEVEVTSDGRNVARQGKASQKNTAHGGDAGKAIDGNKAGLYGMGGQTHTQENTENPWWELDLGEEFSIESIGVHNRTDGDLGKRLDGFTLKVLDSSRNEVYKRDQIPAPPRSAEFALPGGGPAALVRRAAMNALVSVRGQETKTFQTLAPFVRDDSDRVAAIRAMQRIPRQHWPAEAAQPLLDSLLASIRKLPTADRTSPAALDALEFADALASLLPPDRARKVRAELGELGVRVIRLGTIFERMAFDKDVLVLRASKPVEIIFENTDLMPHNFVVTQPGSLEEIGLAAEATATDPQSLQRQYVPPSNKILLASRLLQPRESQKLSFTAPTQTGVYPYVCTYPGHWRRMFGAMYVVENLDDYLANPDEYLASNPLPIKDELLKDRRPRTEWKFEDLAAAVAELAGGSDHPSTGHSGRSFTNAKHLFEVASCVACHRMNGAGNEFGPDLAKLDPKLAPADILRELLDPSAKINEKFQTQIFATDAGKVITGIVLAETPAVVKIIENPLVKAEPIELKVSEIAERKKSPTSIMPKGLLDKLTRDEILDLLAYVIARGDRNHELFRGGHEHGTGH